MARERAHPDNPGQKGRLFGLIKSVWRKNLIQRHKFCNKYIRNKRVLDVPCGIGWGTSMLKGAKHVIGIDVSKEAIDYAKEHYENKKRGFFIGDMKNIFLPDNSIDVVLCLEGFEHVDKERGLEFLKETKRVLVEGGLLIMTSPVLNDEGKKSDNPYHKHEYPEKELIALLNENFRIKELKRLESVIPIYRFVLVNSR